MQQKVIQTHVATNNNPAASDNVLRT